MFFSKLALYLSAGVSALVVASGVSLVGITDPAPERLRSAPETSTSLAPINVGPSLDKNLLSPIFSRCVSIAASLEFPSRDV